VRSALSTAQAMYIGGKTGATMLNLTKTTRAGPLRIG